MPDRPRPRLSLSLNGLSARRLAIQTWMRMEGHDAMVWAAAIAFYALFATVPLLVLFLVVTVLQLPDFSGVDGRTFGLGNLTVDEPWTVSRSTDKTRAISAQSTRDQSRGSDPGGHRVLLAGVAVVPGGVLTWQRLGRSPSTGPTSLGPAG